VGRRRDVSASKYDPAVGREPKGPDKITAAIVGAQKAGTSSLAAILGTHPDVALAQGKEAHLFDDADIQADGLTRQRLAQAFPNFAGERIVLDATPSYLYLPGALETLVEHNPDIRVIVVLRDPVERAFSQHGHSVRRGLEDLSFARGLLAEKSRLSGDRDPLVVDSPRRVSSYVDRGRYEIQLDRLQRLVGHVLIVRFQDFVADPATVVLAIQGFLGIAALAPPDEPMHLNRREVAVAPPRLGRAIAALKLRRSARRTEDVLRWQPGDLRAPASSPPLIVEWPESPPRALLDVLGPLGT